MKELIDILMTRRYAAILLILGSAALVYANSLDNAFQYDDRHSIVENVHIRNLENMGPFFHRPELFSRDVDKAMYRPLLLATYALNYAWSEYEVYSYHWVNVALHALCSLLVWLILQELGFPICMALLGGLLFAVHPIASEPVNYISSRSELLGALGLLASFWTYRRSLGENGIGMRLWSLFFFCMGLLGKSVAITLPALLLSADYYSGKVDRRVWARYMPYLAVAAGYLIIVREFVFKAVAAAPVRTLDVQLGTQLKALVYYAKLVVLPSHLNVHHAFAESTPLALAALGSAALLLSLAFLVSRARGRRSAIFMGLSWMIITLLPTLLVPLNVLVNEHRLYLPLVGFVILICGLRGLARLSGLLWGTPVALALLAALTLGRNNAWHSEYSLWADAAHKAPGEVRAYVYMGNAAKEEGRFVEAISRFERALEIEPDNIEARNNLGNVYKAQGQYGRAVQIYKELLEARPNLADVRYNLAHALQRDENYAAALANYRMVSEHSFHYNHALNNSGTIFEKQSVLDSALVYYGRALYLSPENGNFLNNFQRLGDHFFKRRQFAVLEVLCRQILQGGSKHREVRYLLGLAIYSQRRYSESIVECEKLVADFPDFGLGYLQLGNALESSGRLDEAAAAYRRLLEREVAAEDLSEGRRRLQKLERNSM